MEKKKLILDKSRKAVTTPNAFLKQRTWLELRLVEVLMDVNWVVSVICNQLKITLCQKHLRINYWF